MNTKHCPDHIKDFVRNIEEDSIFHSCDWTESGHGYSYEIECTCGTKMFEIYMNENKRTVLQCSRCGKEIVVYDLTLYPATGAENGRDECEMYMYQLENGLSVFRTCVYYEYPDPEPDVDLDDREIITGNSLSWCVIWVYDSKNKMILEILNDETT